MSLRGKSQEFPVKNSIINQLATQSQIHLAQLDSPELQLCGKISWKMVCTIMRPNAKSVSVKHDVLCAVDQQPLSATIYKPTSAV